MACVLWDKARGWILGIGLGLLLQASPPAGIYVDFAAAVPSGVICTGIPVELIATLKVTSVDRLTRDILVNQRGFNPQVQWKAKDGSFKPSEASTVLGETTLPPNGLVFVSRGTYVPPALPGKYTISVIPEADASKTVTLKIVVEDLLLKIHPGLATLAPGQDQVFTATFHGPPGMPLVWSASDGSISSQGNYRAPARPGIQTVTVQHIPSGKRASALVTVANVFSIQPASLELATGQSAHFQCFEAQGLVAWFVKEPGGGSIESDGTYTAPRTPGTYTIQAVQSSDPTRNAMATVRVTPLTLAISPVSTTLGAGQRIQFKAEISQGTCRWSATEGDITQDGMYHAPSAFGTYQISAASSLDPDVRATATVQVNAMELMQVVPEDLTLHIGQTQQFLVPGLPNEAGLSWLVEPPSAGTITENGLFTAGPTPGVCSIMAFLDDAVSAVAVSIIDTKILPDPAQVRPGGSLQFTVQGLSKDTPITWLALPASAGTISGDGLFTAGNQPGNCRISASAGGVEVSTPLRILAGLITPEETLVAPGGTVRFKSQSFDAPGQGMTWRMLGDQPGASLGQDGVYKAPTRQGIYWISAADPAGNAAQAKVVVGPPNGLMVIPEIGIEQDGVYTVWVRLKANNGRVVDGSFVGELQRGLAYPEITFSAKQMLQPLGVDGPYTIARISVTGTSEDETILFDARENLGSTEAFSLEESNKAWIRIGDISDIRGAGRDPSGLLESLLVTIPVELATEGNYRLQATLTAEDGTEIDTYTETKILPRGTYSIVLTFDGQKIHARGGTGSLSIGRFTVEGPVVRSRDFPGSIKGFDFRMFKP